jgi:hypothetical protein
VYCNYNPNLNYEYKHTKIQYNTLSKREEGMCKVGKAKGLAVNQGIGRNMWVMNMRLLVQEVHW